MSAGILNSNHSNHALPCGFFQTRVLLYISLVMKECWKNNVAHEGHYLNTTLIHKAHTPSPRNIPKPQSKICYSIRVEPRNHECKI